MKISAQVQSRFGEHQVTLRTNASEHSLSIPPRASGYGSSANGGGQCAGGCRTTLWVT